MFTRLHRLKLAPKERDVIRLASDGLTDKQIAKQLQVAGATLKTYWARIRTKLNAVNRVHAVAKALTAAFRDAQEEHRRQASAGLRLIESNILGFLVLTVDGDVLEANEEFLRVIGRQREDIECKPIMRVTAPEHQALFTLAIQELETKDQTPPFEVDFMHKNGGRKRALVRLSCASEEGTCVAYVLDMSEAQLTLDQAV
jgi:PAS domain S-box-containing protein